MAQPDWRDLVFVGLAASGLVYANLHGLDTLFGLGVGYCLATLRYMR